VRSPSGAGARRRLLKHLVNLLQAETLGLGNKEVRVDQAASAQRTPEEKHLGTEVGITGILTDQVRRDDGDELEGSARIYVERKWDKHTVFQSQLDAVERPIPRERIGSGKISPITTHAPGPQVLAKNAIEMQMKAISALTAEELPDGIAVPRIPTKNWQMSIPRAP